MLFALTGIGDHTTITFTSQVRIEPGHQLLLIGIANAAVPMHQAVVTRRHLTLLQFMPRLAGVLVSGVLVPQAEVQVLAHPR